MKPLLKSILLTATLSCAMSTLSSQTNAAKATVPFIGCKADGQAGPLDAPKGTSKLVSIPTEAAQKLAYYKAEQGPGVLAPRGWYCFGTYGSSGYSLLISPQPIDPKMLFSHQWQGYTEPIVEFTTSLGDTSGRFAVATTVTRVFPAHMAFARSVIAENMWPASDFHKGPYPDDKLTYKSQDIVEYQTPANTKGLGTDESLEQNTSPIDGVAILTFYDRKSDEISALLHLAVRLPPAQSNLTQFIIQQTEQDAMKSK
jgi:hypothetical protein